ncbi:MAG TPA: NUDIX hydrolase [Rhizobiales bacterium]|nr:NUDIX hydrolase [Hyphomicrobiales bacterium]
MANIIEKIVLYRGWTTLLRLAIEDGASTFFREVEDHGNSAAVLPYDPLRRKATLVRLLRGPMLLSDGEGLSLEAPAGLVDSEAFADAARREALEEAGLRLSAVRHVATVWTSPGITTERMGLFLAEYGVGDRVGKGGGLAEEHENIEVVELDLDELWSRASAGALADMKTFTLVLALKELRPDLFGEAPARTGGRRGP